MNRNSGEYSLFDGYFGASSTCTSDTLRRPVGVLRAGDPQREVGHGHVPEHQVREQHPLLRRLLHVGAGLLQGRRPPHDGARAEHRHREVLLRGRGEDPQAHQGLARHGHPPGAHRPDRRRALLGGRQLGRRRVVPQGHHRLLVRDRRGPLHVHHDRHGSAGRRLPAVLRRGRHGRRPGLLPGQRLARQRGSRRGARVRRRQLRHGRVRLRLRQGRHRRRRRRSTATASPTR